MQHAQQLETFITTYPGKPAFWEIIRLAQELDGQVTLAAGGDIMGFEFNDGSTTAIDYR
jgi:hypothetical protein